MNAGAFNRRENASGRLPWDQIAELVQYWQKSHGLHADGKAGPLTRASIGAMSPRPAPPFAEVPEYTIDGEGWLHGPDVQHVPMDPSWRYSRMYTVDGRPLAIVAHYTATGPGSAINMANRRIVPRVKTDRSASWQISVETDGSIVQMAPFTVGCWHAGKGGTIAGMSPNRCAVGVELVGYGDEFPAAQVAASAGLWRALCDTYPIERARAMIPHSQIRKSKPDPGPVWLRDCAPFVLDWAYATSQA